MKRDTGINMENNIENNRKNNQEGDKKKNRDHDFESLEASDFALPSDSTDSTEEAREPSDEAEQTGYLEQEYRLFHIRDQVERTFSFHYHDFHKIILFLSGKVTYHIEGKSYKLRPGDLILVSRFDIHRPEIDASVPYERVVLWIRDDLEVRDLLSCFQKARERRFHLVRMSPKNQDQIRMLLMDLEKSFQGEEFGAEILQESLFRQFLVYVNRIFLGKRYLVEEGSYRADSRIETLLGYINENLTADLTAEALSKQCYLSKYYLMRRFHEATGYTLHNYVNSKRLLLARTLLDQGIPAGKAAEASGFRDYSTFVRAYRRQFHEIPSAIAVEHRK